MGNTNLQTQYTLRTQVEGGPTFVKTVQAETNALGVLTKQVTQTSKVTGHMNETVKTNTKVIDQNVVKKKTELAVEKLRHQYRMQSAKEAAQRAQAEIQAERARHQQITNTAKEVAMARRAETMAVREQAMGLHQLNMAILGVNMSFLGLSFNMRNLGFISQETAEEFQHVIAPIQMMMTFMNMGLAMNMLYAASLDKVKWKVSALSFAMLGIGFIVGALSTKIPALRAAFMGLGAALLVLTLRQWALNASKLAFLAAIPGWGWAALGVSMALTAAAVGFASAQRSRTRAFAGGVYTTPTPVILGDVGGEIATPLASPRFMAAPAPQQSGNSITIQTLNIKTDTPERFYKEMTRAIQHHDYVRHD